MKQVLSKKKGKLIKKSEAVFYLINRLNPFKNNIKNNCFLLYLANKTIGITNQYSVSQLFTFAIGVQQQFIVTSVGLKVT